jgi:hypothetical protein
MNYRKPRLALLPLVMLGVLGLPGVRTFAQTYAYNAASLATGHNPQAILSADLNGDGRLDLVAANFNDNTISVLIGNPDGSYQPKVDYAVGNNPIAITVDDFDGNGKMDLAVVDNNCPTTPCTAVGSVSVLLGNGDGTFQPHVDKTVGNGPYGVVAHDFDADGKVDLIVTNSQDNNFTLLVGKGDGTFTFKRKLTTGINPHGIVKGDFNRDHKEDVLICDTGESNLTFFRGNGNGTFQNSIKFDTGPNPLNLVTGDVNADGRADVLVANSGNSTVSVLTAILRGHAFATHVDLAIPGIAAAVAIADMNGDGFDDVIATTEAIDGVSIMQSVGDGATFRPRVDFAAGVHPVSVSAGDFNGDGKVDVATLNNLDNSVIILPGKGNGGLQSLMGMPAGALPVAIAAADFNHDGFTDIAVASRSDNVVRILQGNGDGTFTMSPNTIPTGVKPSAMIAVDLTADGFSDLVVTNSADNTISVAVNNQVGGFQAPLTFAVGTKPSAVAAGQFNGDDRFDLVVANQASLNVSLLIGNGDGSFQPPHNFVTGLGTSPTGIAVGDFIGNGKLDVAVASGTGTVAVLLGQGDGTLTLPTQYPTAAGPNGIVTADFNGDGKLDLAVSTSSGVVSVLQGVGNGTFQTPVDFPVAATPLAVAVGDINGDGKQDLVTGSSSLTINRIGVLLGNGDGTFQAPTYHATKLNASGATEATALADFNNDGSLDVAAADHIANSLAVYLNSPLPALFPGSLDFGAELIGQPGPSQTVTLYNSGSALLNNLDITTDDPSEYSQVNGCGTSLAVGANCTIEVTFTPFNGGARNANIVLSDNGLGGPQTVGLTGIGSGPGAVLSVTSLTFPTTVIGTTSSRQTVILTNTGTETLNISSKVVTPVDFKLIPIGCGSTLSAGNSCGLGIAFAPTASGIITGSLTITDDAFGSPQVVSLTGTGTVVKLTPTALSFGPQAVGTSSSPQTVTLDNVGSATLNFTDTLITITGNNPLDFSQTNTCGTSVAGHGSCTITVTFTPTASGERDATVSISDDGGGSPQELPLSGNGT